jgi:hypothetical protein
MDYESYFSAMSSMVDSGKAVYIGGVLCFAEGVLFVIMLVLTLRKASEIYKTNTGSKLSFATTVVSAAVCSLISVFVYIAPYIKAAIYNIYINDTLTKSYLKTTAEQVELAQGFGNVALIIFTVVLLWTVLRMRKQADFELQKGENLPNDHE